MMEGDSLPGDETETTSHSVLNAVCFSPPVLLSSLPPLQMGTILGGRYRIDRFLGRGGVGAAYQTTDLKWNGTLALKVVIEEGGGLSGWLAYEYSVFQRVEQNAHILRLYEPVLVEHEGCPLSLLPMEWADGGSLRDWIQNRASSPFHLENVLDLFIEACRGVESLHKVHVAHLDIKPENLLLVRGRLKVADLASARVDAPSFMNGFEQIPSRRRGTPAYRSPEQFVAAREEDIDHRSDIYSLGVVLYELLDGSRPFDGDEAELRDKHLSLPPPVIRRDSGDWWPITRRCLSKGVLERYQSVEELLRDVDRRRRGLPGAGDVACKVCGHLNRDERALTCAVCGTNLGEVFRECPKCGTKNRLDVEICRVCGTSVAWLFFGLDRMQRIRQSFDSDPGQAVTDLEEILRLKIPGIENEALDLLRVVRGRMEQISGDLEEGERVWRLGRVVDALDSWNRVLSVFPHHRSVCEKVLQAQVVLAEIESLRHTAESCLESARFGEGQELLRAGLARFPGADELRSLLAQVPVCQDRYRNAFAAARNHVSALSLALALVSLEAALSTSPKSEEALLLQHQILESVKKVEALLDQAAKDFEAALFPKAFSCLEQVNNLQKDNPQLDCLRGTGVEKQAGYTESFSQASVAYEVGDLEGCLKAVQDALSFCPASEEASGLAREVENRLESCRALLESVAVHLKAARFQEAAVELKTIESQWAFCPGLGDLKKNADKTKCSYAACMEAARKALRKWDRNGFFEAVSGALSLCPDSVEAKDLAKSPPPVPPPPVDLSWLFILVGWGGLIAAVCWLVYSLVMALAAGVWKVWLVTLEDPLPLLLSFLFLSVITGIVGSARSSNALLFERFVTAFILPFTVSGVIVGFGVGIMLCQKLLEWDNASSFIGGLVAANVSALVLLIVTFRSR